MQLYLVKPDLTYYEQCQRVKGDGSFWQPLAILFGKQGRTLIKIKVRPRFSIVKPGTLIYNFNNKRKIGIDKQGGNNYMTKDNEINKILDRAEKYRKQLHSTETTPQSSSSEDNLEFEKIFKDFFGNKTDNN